MRRTLQPQVALGMAVMRAAIAAGCGGAQRATGTTAAAPTDTSVSDAGAAHTTTATQFPSYGVSVTPTVWKRAVTSGHFVAEQAGGR